MGSRFGRSVGWLVLFACWWAGFLLREDQEERFLYLAQTIYALSPLFAPVSVVLMRAHHITSFPSDSIGVGILHPCICINDNLRKAHTIYALTWYKNLICARCLSILVIKSVTGKLKTHDTVLDDSVQ
jgi:hypothetical protein